MDLSCASDDMRLAFAYVPCQKFENMYEINDALHHGTIFIDLDIPFEAYKNNPIMNPFN